MSLLISDANIFIDFEEGRILERVFALSDEIGVPDLLFEEELREQHSDLLDLGLRLVELEAPAVERIVDLAARYPHPSRLDLAALAAAEQESCPLLTGDRRLRAAAEEEGVEVHGTLWLAARLVREGHLSVQGLRQAYSRMRAVGRRLPWEKVQVQLRELSR